MGWSSDKNPQLTFSKLANSIIFAIGKTNVFVLTFIILNMRNETYENA